MLLMEKFVLDVNLFLEYKKYHSIPNNVVALSNLVNRFGSQPYAYCEGKSYTMHYLIYDLIIIA
jgi:hypothetical protein